MKPIHPGEILLEEFIKPLGMNANSLAKQLCVPVTRISKIVHGERSISCDTALRLARFFNTSPEFWANLQQHYDLEIERRKSVREIAKIQPLAV